MYRTNIDQEATKVRRVNDLNEAEPRLGILYVGQGGDAAIIDRATHDLVAASGVFNAHGSALGAVVSVRDPERDDHDVVFEGSLFKAAGVISSGAYRVMYDDGSDTWVTVDDAGQVAVVEASRLPLQFTTTTLRCPYSRKGTGASLFVRFTPIP